VGEVLWFELVTRREGKKKAIYVRRPEPACEGELKTWYEDRGFGFIEPFGSGHDVFIHLSEFPRGSAPPTVGEILRFDVTLNPEGKKKAINVHRVAPVEVLAPVVAAEAPPSVAAPQPAPAAAVTLTVTVRWLWGAALLASLAGLGLWAWLR